MSSVATAKRSVKVKMVQWYIVLHRGEGMAADCCESNVV